MITLLYQSLKVLTNFQGKRHEQHNTSYHRNARYTRPRRSVIISLLKCIIICVVCLLQYGIVLLNLDKIHILKQFVNINVRSSNSYQISVRNVNTNKVEEVGRIREDRVINRNDHGFPII